MSGFCHSLAVFKQIDKTDIDCVEQFVRDDLSAMWDTKTVELPYGNELNDAFGPFYAFDPSKFKFLPGDRKLIENLVAHVNDIEEKKEVKAKQTIENAVSVKDSNSGELYMILRSAPIFSSTNCNRWPI